MNLAAVEDMNQRFPRAELCFIESGGDNLAATFSPELADLTIYVIDVAAGEKIPRKGGPGITRSDLLVINKIDLAPLVDANLEVMQADALRMRGKRPFVAMQAGIINPFITRPEHSQFILLVAVALIIVNVLLIAFGPDARNVQTSYSFDSFLVGPLIIDAINVYAGAATVVITAALFGFFRFAPLGKAIRACADNYTGALVVGLNVKHLYDFDHVSARGCQ